MAVLLIAAVAWPVPMFSRADPLVIPTRICLSWFYGFWLPLTQNLSPGVVWGGYDSRFEHPAVDGEQRTKLGKPVVQVLTIPERLKGRVVSSAGNDVA